MNSVYFDIRLERDKGSAMTRATLVDSTRFLTLKEIRRAPNDLLPNYFVMNTDAFRVLHTIVLAVIAACLVTLE